VRSAGGGQRSIVAGGAQACPTQRNTCWSGTMKSMAATFIRLKRAWFVMKRLDRAAAAQES